MFGTLKLKIIAGVIGAGLLLGAFLFVKDAFDDRRELTELVSAILVETRIAVKNPDLKSVDIAIQIKTLGESFTDLSNQLTVQNEAVDALSEERIKALDYADQQAALREEVIEKSKGLAARLRTEALTPVQKDQLEAELRKVQDKAWEIGL